MYFLSLGRYQSRRGLMPKALPVYQILYNKLLNLMEPNKGWITQYNAHTLAYSTSVTVINLQHEPISFSGNTGNIFTTYKLHKEA